MADEQSWRVIGPLHGRLVVSDEDGRPRFRRRDQREDDPRTAANKANARLILHRTAVAAILTSESTGSQQMTGLDDRPARNWAVETGLGQQRGDDLAAHIAARRRIALQSLAAARNMRVLAVEIEPQGAFVTGTAEGGIRNVGIELHGTYGWPTIPASTLKGAAAAYALDTAEPDVLDRIFGRPRPGQDNDDTDQAAKPGSVLFFDALPGKEGVTVAEHVLTPHVRDYHMTDSDGSRKAPAEYLNPVPIPFLVVDGGTFTSHLLGPEREARVAAELLIRAMDDIGVGAKTSAGYGYLSGAAMTLSTTAE